MLYSAPNRGTNLPSHTRTHTYTHTHTHTHTHTRKCSRIIHTHTHTHAHTHTHTHAHTLQLARTRRKTSPKPPRLKVLSYCCYTIVTLKLLFHCFVTLSCYTVLLHCRYIVIIFLNAVLYVVTLSSHRCYMSGYGTTKQSNGSSVMAKQLQMSPPT
jgi:hypothetical protein